MSDFDLTTFDPENWQHWALVMLNIGMAIWGYWLVSRAEAQGNSHAGDRGMSIVNRQSEDD